MTLIFRIAVAGVYYNPARFLVDTEEISELDVLVRKQLVEVFQNVAKDRIRARLKAAGHYDE